MNVVVLRSGALGDFVLTLPVLSALREGLPGADIVYVGRDGFGRLARLAGLADRTISQETPAVVALHSGVTDAGGRFVRTAGRVDLAISFLGSDDVARNLLHAGAGEVLSCSARPKAAGVHASDHLLSVLRGRLDVPSPAVPRIEVPAALKARARAILGEGGIPSGRYLVLQPGSGAPRKNWPAGRFRELARLARCEMGLAVAVVLGPAELDRDPDRASEFASVADTVLESPQLPVLAGLLAGAAAYVGNDSGVSHLAAACGAPTVAVFGPTEPAAWAPRGPHVRMIRDPSCDLGSVQVASVLEALREFVAGGC